MLFYVFAALAVLAVLVLVGALYFLVRRWLWRRFIGGAATPRSDGPGNTTERAATFRLPKGGISEAATLMGVGAGLCLTS
jgi:hypothetical protein